MTVFLKKADISDAMTLFEWTNENEVRQNSFQSNPIKLNDHMTWFQQKIISSTSQIFILFNNEIPIGQIRIEIVEDMLEISYSIDFLQRGQGYGKMIIKLVEQKVKKLNKTTTIMGKVKKENIASIKAFEANAYKKIDKGDHLVFVKEL